MIVNVVRIGNSRGIRIPKPILEQCNMGSQMSLEVEDNRIVLKPIEDQPREGWDEAFRRMHEEGDDALIIDDDLDIEMDEWEWQ